MGQTVNLLVFTFGGSNPSLPTFFLTPVGVAKFINKELMMQALNGVFLRK